MAITTISSLKSALTRRSAAKTKEVLLECMTFAIDQLNKHSNCSPLGIVLSRLNEVAGKPKGCKVPTMIKALEAAGLKVDKIKGSYVVSIDKKKRKSTKVEPLVNNWWEAYAEDNSNVVTLKLGKITKDKIQEKAETLLKRAKVSDQDALRTQRDLLKAQLAAVESCITEVSETSSAKAS